MLEQNKDIPIQIGLRRQMRKNLLGHLGKALVEHVAVVRALSLTGFVHHMLELGQARVYTAEQDIAVNVQLGFWPGEGGGGRLVDGGFVDVEEGRDLL